MNLKEKKLYFDDGNSDCSTGYYLSKDVDKAIAKLKRYSFDGNDVEFTNNSIKFWGYKAFEINENNISDFLLIPKENFKKLEEK